MGKSHEKLLLEVLFLVGLAMIVIGAGMLALWLGLVVLGFITVVWVILSVVAGADLNFDDEE